MAGACTTIRRSARPFDASADVADLGAVGPHPCPTFVLHGGESVLLTAETLAEMQRRGPPVQAVTFPGVGHAPALMAQDQIEAIVGWLGV